MNKETKAVVRPTNNDTVAGATSMTVPNEVGQSVVVGFRYIGKWAHISLKNGVAGIIGSSEQYPFGTILSLKGSGMQCRYERTADRVTPKGTYKSYHLEWSLE